MTRPYERDFEIHRPYDQGPDVEPGSPVEIRRAGETVWTGHVADPEDEGAARGLVIGLTLAVAFWTLVVLSWRFAAVGTFVLDVVKAIAAVGGFFAVVWVANRRLLRFRAEHPDNAVVDWLDRAGL